MTYRELTEICYKRPLRCSDCEYRAECYVFDKETGVTFPYELYSVLKFDFDKEIEVEE